MTHTTPAGDSSPPPFMSTPPARPTGVAGKVHISAATPDAVLAVVPHLLGFYPSRSLVVLGLGRQSRVMVTFRYDLPYPADAQLADDIAEHASYVLDREQISAALLVGYGPAELVLPVALTVGTKLLEDGVSLQEVLRAEAGRFWSMLCQDPDCCPPEGRSYDPGSHPTAAAMNDAGLGAHPDRAALARTIQRPAAAGEAIDLATARAQLTLDELVSRGKEAGDLDPRLRATRTGRRQVQSAIRRYRVGGSITDIEHLTWLAVLLADLRVRDDAWARMDPAHREAHCRLWTDVLRCAALDYAPAPACLLAFTAWQLGNGALAAIALDRALTADPDYSMARLLEEAIAAVLPPSAARLPMSPAAVALSYAAPSSGRLRTGSGNPRAVRVQKKRRSRAARSRRKDSATAAGGGQHGRPRPAVQRRTAAPR